MFISSQVIGQVKCLDQTIKKSILKFCVTFDSMNFFEYFKWEIFWVKLSLWTIRKIQTNIFIISI